MRVPTWVVTTQYFILGLHVVGVAAPLLQHQLLPWPVVAGALLQVVVVCVSVPPWVPDRRRRYSLLALGQGVLWTYTARQVATYSNFLLFLAILVFGLTFSVFLLRGHDEPR